MRVIREAETLAAKGPIVTTQQSKTLVGTRYAGYASKNARGCAINSRLEIVLAERDLVAGGCLLLVT